MLALSRLVFYAPPILNHFNITFLLIQVKNESFNFFLAYKFWFDDVLSHWDR